jgi:hypothetical protein
MTRIKRVCLSIPILFRALSAHTVSLTYAEVTVDDRQVRWSLKLPVPELDLLLGLDQNHDGNVDAAEIGRSQSSIQQYVMSKLHVLDNGGEVPGTIGVLWPWKDPEGHPFLRTDAVFTTPDRTFGRITLRCELLRDVVASHRTLAKISAGGQTREFVFERGRSYEVDARPSLFQTGLQFV